MATLRVSAIRRKLIKYVTVAAIFFAAALYIIPPDKFSLMDFIFKKHPEKMLPADYNIVPNIVHFIRFGLKNLTFIEAVCILAALKNQKPAILMIHTEDKNFDNNGGKYWEIVKNHSVAARVIQIKFLPMPDGIFQHKFNKHFKPWHASDVARLRVLQKYGGIYLDADSYVVQSLDEFRRYEMTLGWEEGGGISDQVLIAAKNAEFLQVWLDSYRDYKGELWFYNGGDKPSEILRHRPYLVHAVPHGLAEYRFIPTMLYLENTNLWKYHHVIHLLINHQYLVQRNLSDTATYPVKFNETNILKYPATIRKMALEVYPFDCKHLAKFNLNKEVRRCT